jgi:hypothetical protein
MRKFATLSRVFPLSLVIAGFVFLLGIQSVNPAASKDEDPPSLVQAYTVPISETKIVLEIAVDNRRPIKVTQLEGGLIRIEKKGVAIFGFTPYIVDQKTGAVAVKAFSIIPITREGKTIGESISEIGRIEPSTVGSDSVAAFHYGDSQFTFQIKQVQPGAALNYVLEPDNPSTLEFIMAVSRCCVTCDGVTTCACAVSADCGSCCAGVCCNSGTYQGSAPKT